MYKKNLILFLIMSFNNIFSNPNDVTAIVRSYQNKKGKVWVGHKDLNLTDGYLRLGNDPAPNEIKSLALYNETGNLISCTQDGQVVTIPDKVEKALYGNTHLLPSNIVINKKSEPITAKAVIAADINTKKVIEKDTQ